MVTDLQEYQPRFLIQKLKPLKFDILNGKFKAVSPAGLSMHAQEGGGGVVHTSANAFRLYVNMCSALTFTVFLKSCQTKR